MMKLKLFVILCLVIGLLCGCGGNVIQGAVDMEETVETTTENNNPFWVPEETVSQETVSAAEYPYDYTRTNFFDMTNCWDYAPLAVAKGVLSDGSCFSLPADDGFRVAQGACSDGKYGYFFLAKPGTVIDGVSQDSQYLYKVDLETWEVVKRSDELFIQHANGACYNAKLGKIISANMSPDGKNLSVIDPETLTLVDTVTIAKDIAAIAYNETRDQYVVRLVGTQAFDFAILDSDFNWVAEYNGVNGWIGIQSIACDDNYIYRLDSGCVKKPGTEGVFVYDWDGNYQGVYRVAEDINGTINREVVETEALFVHDGEFYISFNDGTGGRYFRLDMDLDKLYW